MSGFMDGVFNTSGKIPTNSNFWEIGIDEFVTSEGITSGFSRVIAEQVFRPVKSPQIKFYEKFVGKPIASGYGWMERAIAKTVAKKFKPKATANDDLSFYDSEGIEKLFKIDYEGWRPVTLPSELATVEQMLNYGSVGTLNNILVDNVLKDYQRDMESAIQKKMISTTTSETTVDITDASAIRRKVSSLATQMMGNKTHYNELTVTENAKIYTASEKVLAFINMDLYNFMIDSKAILPSPGELTQNVEYIPVVDDLATPLTTVEHTAGQTSNSWDDEVVPSAVDKDAPVIYLCSADRCVVRPLINSYRINLSKNGAGDFMNQHLLWKCAIGIRPWENAIRINAAPEEPETPEG